MTVSKLKKELDKWFSLYIRLREATDEGLVQCFTCGNVNNYKVGMQNGHFMSRQFMQLGMMSRIVRYNVLVVICLNLVSSLNFHLH
jgi:hypothetical protein